MACKIIWSPVSIGDLEGIHAYISQSSVGYADSMIGRIVERVELLADFPNLGPPINRKSRLRKLSVRPYKVIYRVAPHHVEIVTVVHGARALNDLLRRLGNE